VSETTEETLCSECLRMTGYDIVNRHETYEVRGEKITVDAQVAVCRLCGEDIGLAELDDTAFAAAYALYRARHNLLQPEQIKAIRSKYGLGQKAFARLLGWGDVTLARYETGSLQSESHDSQLRLAEEPANIRVLLERNGDHLTHEQRVVLEQCLGELSSEHETLLVREESSLYESSAPVRKLQEMIVYFAGQKDTWRTKLNKLLFYSDFLHFKRSGTSISDARYVRMQYGPVPADFYRVQARLVDDGSIDERPAHAGDCEGTVFVALRQADVALFTEDELGVMVEVAAHFAGWSASRISEFSHREPAWLEAEPRATIPYKKAVSLQLS